MKKHYTSLLLIVIALCFPLLGLSQATVSFGYDASGNRTGRDIILAKSSDVTSADSTDKELQEQHYIDLFSDVKVTISPNPNGGRFKVMVEQTPGTIESQDPFQLYLHSLSGESIRHIERLEPVNEVDISYYPNGTYVLTIARGNDKRTWKVIKQ